MVAWRYEFYLLVMPENSILLIRYSECYILCILYYTSTVNCPIRELDLYHITSQFIIELPSTTWYSSSNTTLARIVPAVQGNPLEYHPLWRVIRARANTTRENHSCQQWRLWRNKKLFRLDNFHLFCTFASVFKIVSV